MASWVDVYDHAIIRARTFSGYKKNQYMCTYGTYQCIVGQTSDVVERVKRGPLWVVECRRAREWGLGRLMTRAGTPMHAHRGATHASAQ